MSDNEKPNTFTGNRFEKQHPVMNHIPSDNWCLRAAVAIELQFWLSRNHQGNNFRGEQIRQGYKVATAFAHTMEIKPYLSVAKQPQACKPNIIIKFQAYGVWEEKRSRILILRIR